MSKDLKMRGASRYQRRAAAQRPGGRSILAMFQEQQKATTAGAEGATAAGAEGARGSAGTEVRGRIDHCSWVDGNRCTGSTYLIALW